MFMMYKLHKNFPLDFNRALEKAQVLRRINKTCQRAVDICDGKYEPSHHEHLQAHDAVEILGYSSYIEGPHLPMPVEVLAEDEPLSNAEVFVRTVGFCVHLGDKVLLCPVNTENSQGEAGGSGCGAWKSVCLEVEEGAGPAHGDAVHVLGSLCPRSEGARRGPRTVRARLWQKVTLEEAQRIQEMLQRHSAQGMRQGKVPLRYLDGRVDRVKANTASAGSGQRGAKMTEEKEKKEVPYLSIPIEQLVSMEHLAQGRTLVHTVGFCIYYYGKPFICSLESETVSKEGSFKRDAEGAVGPWRSLPLEVPKSAQRSLLPHQLCFTHRSSLQVWGALCLDKSKCLVLRVTMWANPSLRSALNMQKQLEKKFELLKMKGADQMFLHLKSTKRK